MPNFTIDILVIADNIDNKKLYQLIFRSNDYNLVFVDGIEEATSIIEEAEVKVIIFDCTVVGANIVNFFESMEQLHACMQKVLVTDYIDHSQISELISRGRIFNYITKPIDPKRLSVVVHKAVEQYVLHKRNDTLLENVQAKNYELKHVLGVLKEEEEKFRNIFNSSPDPQFIIDKEGTILDSNSNAVIFCCKGNCNCKGKSIFELVRDDDVYRLVEYVKSIVDNKYHRLEVKSKANGDLREKDYEVASYSFKHKGIQSYMLTLRDISERKELHKKMMQTIIQTEEKERRRFAQELHDGIGPLLSTSKLYLQWYNKPKAKLDKSVIISKIEETLEETILSLREISNNISPNILLNFGLKAALKKFIGRIHSVSGMRFEYDCRLSNRLDQQNEITIYRLICELINNSIKHSQASVIKIVIHENERLDICFEDDGKGFDVEMVIQEKKGSGLINIINRVKSLGGQYNIMSAEGAGTRVEVSLNN